MTNVPPTIEAWLFELKHRKSLLHNFTLDASDPYNKAVAIFQNFTNSVIDGLERKDPDVVSLIHENYLAAVYSRVPKANYYSPEYIRQWVREDMLKHPLRRKECQFYFLAIVQAQSNGELKSVKCRLLAAHTEFVEWTWRVYDPENLVKDPSGLWFLRNRNGIKAVEPSTTALEDACLICTEGFDQDSHAAKRAPCGHILCGGCFDKWLLKCSRTYSCPLCRACVVCGANDCKHHDVHLECAPPVPLPDILDFALSDSVGQSLHGIEPRVYFKLREDTRQDRVLLEWISQLVKQAQRVETDPVFVRLTKDGVEVMQRVVRASLQARTESANESPAL